jgi:nucleoside-diphosphate-sugar epimerase
MQVAIAGSTSVVAGALREACRREGHGLAMMGRSADADVHYEAEEPFAASVRLDDFDAIAICSASFEGGTIEGMRRNLVVNVEGTLRLLKLASDSRVPHLLYVSTVSAIAGADSYGLTKQLAEKALLQLCPQLDMKLTIVRPSQVYDTSGAAAHHQPFFYNVLRQVAAGRSVTIYGSKDVERNYLHVDDLARALVACLRLGTTGTLNAVHPTSTKVSELVEIACRAFESPSRIAFDPAKPDLAALHFPQSDNIFEVIPTLSCRSLDHGLREIAAQWKAREARVIRP